MIPVPAGPLTENVGLFREMSLAANPRRRFLHYRPMKDPNRKQPAKAPRAVVAVTRALVLAIGAAFLIAALLTYLVLVPETKTAAKPDSGDVDAAPSLLDTG